MARDTEIVGDALVEIINAKDFAIESEFTFDVVAERVYESTNRLEDLNAIQVDVISLGKSKTRNDRSQLKTTQVYGVFVRKRFGVAEFAGAKISETILDSWLSFIDDLENVAWSGKFSSVAAVVEAVEQTTPYDADELKKTSMLISMLQFQCAWYPTYQ